MILFDITPVNILQFLRPDGRAIYLLPSIRDAYEF